jgi:hypothetical protein
VQAESMITFGEKKTVVLSLGDLLTKEQVNSALAVPETQLLWRAIMQTLWNYREEASIQASGYALQNNSHAMASAHGGHEILTTILQELEKRRRTAYGNATE